LLTAFGVHRYLTSLDRVAAQERAKLLVSQVANAAPDDVAAAIEQLKPNGHLVLPLLRERLQAIQDDSSQLLHVAFALAALGEVEEEFFLQRMATIPDSEVKNVAVALAVTSGTSIPKLLKKIKEERDPVARARSATVLLHLGSQLGAEQELAQAADPTSRTMFIRNFGKWHGDLRSLPTLLMRSRSSDFQSGICLALGLMDAGVLGAEQRNALEKVFQHLHRDSPDGGVHSASGWVLQRWKRELPALETFQRAPAGQGWFVNRHKMTLVKIKPGTFTMGDPELKDSVPHQVTLTRQFFLCDREITFDQFREFMDDRDYPADQKPQNWKDRQKRDGYSGKHPVCLVSWFDAVLFCNWLSHVEGRQQCYSRKGESWSCSLQADGYRLPTEAEWEYACRAMTTAPYFFGDNPKDLPDYAYFNLNSEGHPWPGALKLPNSWGLFDMHGNVAEWCWDYYDMFRSEEYKDPQGPSKGRDRLIRGGDFFYSAERAHSGRHTDRVSPHNRMPFIGFRVTCSENVLEQ
jgi:formylglycine-generating enzyme required for sulfatase activity